MQYAQLVNTVIQASVLYLVVLHYLILTQFCTKTILTVLTHLYTFCLIYHIAKLQCLCNGNKNYLNINKHACHSTSNLQHTWHVHVDECGFPLSCKLSAFKSMKIQSGCKSLTWVSHLKLLWILLLHPGFFHWKYISENLNAEQVNACISCVLDYCTTLLSECSTWCLNMIHPIITCSAYPIRVTRKLEPNPVDLRWEAGYNLGRSQG